MDPVLPLRMAATRELLGEIVGSDRLIAAAVDAVLAGVSSPALLELAALGRREEPEAHDLFRRVVEELDLAPELPADPVAARWELVRWWCEQIVAGLVPPEVGGRWVWIFGWEELAYPAALQPMVGWVSEWEDWSESWGVPRETYDRRIVDEANRLLRGPWPPYEVGGWEG